MKSDKKTNLTILAVPCKKPFIVSKDKAKEFISLKNTKYENQQISKMAETFRKNNLIDETTIPTVPIKKISLKKK